MGPALLNFAARSPLYCGIRQDCVEQALHADACFFYSIRFQTARGGRPPAFTTLALCPPIRLIAMAQSLVLGSLLLAVAWVANPLFTPLPLSRSTPPRHCCCLAGGAVSRSGRATGLQNYATRRNVPGTGMASFGYSYVASLYDTATQPASGRAAATYLLLLSALPVNHDPFAHLSSSPTQRLRGGGGLTKKHHAPSPSLVLAASFLRMYLTGVMPGRSNSLSFHDRFHVFVSIEHPCWVMLKHENRYSTRCQKL